MAKLLWNQAGERFYETGVDRGVLYPKFLPGVAWNGLVAVDEDSFGGEVTPYYYDGVKYLDFVANEDFKATIEAFSAPSEFASCDGSKTLSPGLFATQQPRTTFGLSYRTLIGNDLEGTNLGYKLHLVYGATAEPSSKKNQSISGSIDPTTRQWAIHTVPPTSTSYKPTAHFVIDSTLANPAKLAVLENLLYGTSSSDPSLPMQSIVIATLT